MKEVEKIYNLDELLKLTKEQHEMTHSIKGGIARLLDSHTEMLGSQNHMMSLLDELRPLRSLPDISNNLSRIVEKLIPAATFDRNKKDWPSIATIGVLCFLLVVVILKETDFIGAIKGFGAEASISHSNNTNNNQKKTEASDL